MEKLKAILNLLLNVIVTVIVLTSLFFTFSVVNPNFARITGKYMHLIPYAEYILEYVKTIPGLIVCIMIPCVVLFVYSSILLTDLAHNSSKHRKKIVRKRKRRNKRYLKEGLHRDRRAVI